MKKHPNPQAITQEFLTLTHTLYADKTVSIPADAFSRTVHIAVDMINGFVKEGTLASPEVLTINPDVAAFASVCETAGIQNLALCDCHPAQCSEFLTYPVHCVSGTRESELTDELKAAADFRIFPKLSVNGWLEPDFQQYILDQGFDTFILTGDCTDMCVLQLALSLKSGLNRINRPTRVIIPTDLVATWGLPTRSAAAGELAALTVMQSNGIEIVQAIRLTD